MLTVSTSACEEFTPTRSYDLIWMQWVLMYIPDREVVAFLQRCRLRMSLGSAVVVKENVANGRTAEEGVDDEELCVTRCSSHYEALFSQAGFKVARKRQQKRWPSPASGCFRVMMWALAIAP